MNRFCPPSRVDRRSNELLAGIEDFHEDCCSAQLRMQQLGGMLERVTMMRPPRRHTGKPLEESLDMSLRW